MCDGKFVETDNALKQARNAQTNLFTAYEQFVTGCCCRRATQILDSVAEAVCLTIAITNHLSGTNTITAESLVTGYSSSQQASPLRELTCYMGSHGVTRHLAEMTFSLEGCKAELT